MIDPLIDPLLGHLLSCGIIPFTRLIKNHVNNDPGWI